MTQILIAAISNIIGKLVIGWLCDLSCVNTFLVSNIYILLSGISACLLPFCNSYELYAFVVSLYGFFTTIFTIEPCILVELLGLDNLTSAYGLLLFFQVCPLNNILLFRPYRDQRCSWVFKSGRASSTVLDIIFPPDWNRVNYSRVPNRQGFRIKV